MVRNAHDRHPQGVEAVSDLAQVVVGIADPQAEVVEAEVPALGHGSR